MFTGLVCQVSRQKWSTGCNRGGSKGSRPAQSMVQSNNARERTHAHTHTQIHAHTHTHSKLTYRATVNSFSPFPNPHNPANSKPSPSYQGPSHNLPLSRHGRRAPCLRPLPQRLPNLPPFKHPLHLRDREHLARRRVALPGPRPSVRPPLPSPSTVEVPLPPLEHHPIPRLDELRHRPP